MSVISVDTDGIYVSTKPNLNKINEYLDRLTEETFGCENYLHMDIEEYDAAFFRETKGKHYILKRGDKLIFHGASFKGSRVPKFWDQILEEVARKMFNGERISAKDINLTQFDLADLTQSIRVQSKSSYKNKNSLPMQLIRQFEEEVGSELVEDDQLQYIKTKNGYELYIPGKEVHGIDWKYYKRIIQDIFDRLNIQDGRQMTLC